MKLSTNQNGITSTQLEYFEPLIHFDNCKFGGKGALFLLTRFIDLFYLLKIIMGIRLIHMLEEVVGLVSAVAPAFLSLLLP